MTKKKKKKKKKLSWVFIFAFGLAISGTHKAYSALCFRVGKPQRGSAPERYNSLSPSEAARERRHAAARNAQKPRGLSPKVCNFLTQQHAMLLKPYFIVIYAVKARYATSKDATTPLSTSGC